MTAMGPSKNKDIPRILRAMAQGQSVKDSGHSLVLNQAAAELESAWRHLALSRVKIGGKMTDAQVMDELRSNSLLDQARKIFSGTSAAIQQAQLQRRPPTAIEVRRMEFEAVRKIAAVFGVVL
jgi:hypothetical protein